MRKSVNNPSSVVLTDVMQDYINKLHCNLKNNPEKLGQFTKLVASKQFEEKKIIPFVAVKKLHDLLLETKVKDEPVPYIHELLAGSEIYLPQPESQQRSPELEERLRKLRSEQEERIYRQMTRNVSRQSDHDDQLSYKEDLKMLNRQLTLVFNFLVTVGAAFAFGFKGSELMLGVTNMATRMFYGLAVATCVFFADLYFLARGLN